MVAWLLLGAEHGQAVPKTSSLCKALVRWVAACLHITVRQQNVL